MTCRDIESLILAERDGALTPTERAALSDHVAACPGCQKLRADLAKALDTFKTGIAQVSVPDADETWRDLQSRLHESAKPAKKRPLAPVIWFGAPMAAAAAIALLLFNPQRPAAVNAPEVALSSPASGPASSLYDTSVIAGADYVEAGNPNASTLVYVDKESGWLVVWATDAGDTKTSG